MKRIPRGDRSVLCYTTFGAPLTARDAEFKGCIKSGPVNPGLAT